MKSLTQSEMMALYEEWVKSLSQEELDQYPKRGFAAAQYAFTMGFYKGVDIALGEESVPMP